MKPITFPTPSSEPRPIRLKDATRAWAWESLHGKYGDEAKSTPRIDLDYIENFESLSAIGKQDVAIREIAANAPLRLCPEEKICGAATLGDAISHIIPVKYLGNIVYYSVSHLTIRYDKVIREGLDRYSEDIARRLEDKNLTDDRIEFLNSLQNVIESIRIWHGRYLKATETDRPDLHRLLEQVPFAPARNFHEALQSLWFIFAFVRLCGNWPGIGRIDWLLGDYLKRDLADGTLTLDEARELLASFFIKGCEWIQSNTPIGTGDAQHYQNLILAGVDEDGCEVTNEVTYLVLDVVEELGISDFPITVRLNKKSPSALKEKMAQVMRHGGGVVAIYNEDLVLNALSNLGYPEREARTFANDGCWEVQVPGKTNFEYLPFDSLRLFNDAVGISSEKIPQCETMEEVYALFRNTLQKEIEDVWTGWCRNRFKMIDGEWRLINTRDLPTSVVSLFEDGCIESALAYRDHGPTYMVRSPHIGGAPDVGNSLYAIEKLVFEEKKVTLPELIEIVRNNWEGHEELRNYVKNKYTYYGNDNDEADRWHSRILNDFADIVSIHNTGDRGIKFIPGVSTFGRQIDWLPERSATVFGAKKGEILSGNDSPVPGTDTRGATAIIKSYCKSDLVKQACGAALDLKLLPDSIKGEKGIAALVGLMDGFITLGGYFMQIDTVDVETLREAQRDPEKFKTLAVRVSGWSARFVTLNEEWQNMIIERTGHGV